MAGISGKYRLDTRLGGGGMAEVFLGSMVGAEGFSRRVAIKRVLPGFSDNPQFSKMFVDEAQISAQLQHPNIVSVLDFDRDAENRLFLVMELVEGRDLDALVSSGLLPVPLVIFLITEVLRGLGHAHDLPVSTGTLRGIIHRDVSPHNVLLSWDGAVKVSDFGIAKAREASAATASVLIKGKPAYMSPEQANGEALDGRSDLFAVGVMLWEMLCGRRLFIGEDTRSTLAAVLFGQVPRPRSIRGDVPKDVERVVMKMLERDIQARYPTAEAAVSDLLDCTDSPKTGRELLMKTLAERFPEHAPVRGSVMRSRSGQPSGTPGGYASLPPSSSTLGDGRAANQGVAAMPSLGAGRNAITNTIGANPHSLRRSGTRTAVMIAAGLASAVLAFLVVLAITKKPKPKLADAGSGSALVANVKPATEIDAGMPDAPPVISRDAAVAPMSPDAGVPQVAASNSQKDATSTRPSHPATDKKPSGKIYVTAMPTLTIAVDGRKYGDSPMTISVPAGKHSVRLTNEDTGYKETVQVVVEPDKTVDIPRFK